MVRIPAVTLQISPFHKAGSMRLFSYSVYLAGTQPSQFSQSSCSGRNRLQSTLRETHQKTISPCKCVLSPQCNAVGPWPLEVVQLHLILGVDKLECVQKRVNTVMFLAEFMTYEEQCNKLGMLSLELKEDSGRSVVFICLRTAMGKRV